MADLTRYREVRKSITRLKNKPEAMARGLKKGGLYLQRQSQLVVPVDTGALRNSAFTRIAYAYNTVVVTVGYTVAYAIYVHENPDAQHAPGKTYKYLELPYRLHYYEIVNIVKAEIAKG